MTTFPSFDGHFWVERNGEIIDFHFPEYDFIKKVNGCSGEPIYLSAPLETQQLVIKIMDNCVKSVFKGENIEECKKSLCLFSIKYGRETPRFNCCLQNCIMEIYKNGGNLVFGSMGWRKKNGTIHYEYGGENYLTWKDFKK